MNFYCKRCRTPLKHGQQICTCGQIFVNPVPDTDDQIGVVYWEPPRPTSSEVQVQRVKDFWDNINPASKAAIFGVLAFLLIGFAIIGYHSPFHHAEPLPIATIPPPIPSPNPAQASPVVSMPTPIVLASPSSQKTNDGSNVNNDNTSAPAVLNPAENGNQTNSPESQQPTPQQQEAERKIKAASDSAGGTYQMMLHDYSPPIQIPFKSYYRTLIIPSLQNDLEIIQTNMVLDAPGSPQQLDAQIQQQVEHWLTEAQDHEDSAPSDGFG